MLAIAGLLSACGGGDDLEGNRVTLPIGGGGTGGTDQGGGAETPAETGSVTLTVVDQSSGETKNSISYSTPSLAKAVVTDANGQPVVNAIVSFGSSDSAAVEFSPASTALTDSNGLASVNVKASSSSTAGAYRLTATTFVADQVLQSSFNVTVDPTDAALGPSTVTLTVVDQSTGETRNSISYSTLSVAKAVVKDGKGNPVANAIVSFGSSDPAAVVFSPASTALTDSSGLASVTVRPAAISTAGAYRLTAATEVADQALQSSFNVAVGAAEVALGSLTPGQSPLSAYGTTVLTVPVSGATASAPVAIRFTSNCASQNPAKATIGGLVSSSGGVASTTYVDRGCAGEDLITATVEGTSISQSTRLQVLTPAIANIQFVSASPAVIALRGTGGVQGPVPGVPFPEISTVRFQVVDQAGNPVSSPTNVTLRLSNNTGGILIDRVQGPVVKQTDANGLVEVQVQSGNAPTPVWVIATISTGTTTLTTNSVQLAVSTGLPVQGRFTATAPYYNIEAWYYDGEALDFRARAAEAFGNPVPDGTAVSFVTEAGKIDANCQTGVDTGGRPLPGDGDPGECTVQFVSQGDRPWQGRSTMTAYLVGEEGYEDANGNGRYEPGEVFYDQGRLFVDFNEDGSYQSSELSVPFIEEASGACGATPWGGSVPGTCDGQWGLAHVRDSKVIVWSGSFGYFRTSQVFPTPNTSNIPTSYQLSTATCTVRIPFWLQDLNGNPMPYDTTVTARLLSVQGGGDTADDWGVAVQNDRIVSTIARGGTFHTIVVRRNISAGGCSQVVGSVEIRVTTPKGNLTFFEASFAP